MQLCDICQECRPFNRPTASSVHPTLIPTSEPALQPREATTNRNLPEFALLTDDEFKEQFKGSPVKRTKWRGLLWNVAVAHAGSDDPAAKQVLTAALEHPERLAREHATSSLNAIHERSRKQSRPYVTGCSDFKINEQIYSFQPSGNQQDRLFPRRNSRLVTELERMNTLYYGDNLDILREYVSSNSIDLIYLDPPFNSARNFNVLFSDQKGVASEAQVSAFTDTWTWNQRAAETYHYLITATSDDISQLISAIRHIVQEGPMLAYLVMMAARLLELHRVLKPTGSVYLHCDQTASSYLRVLLDAIFGPKNFRTEIIWKRTNVHSDSKSWSRVSDTIYFYGKSDRFTWNPIYADHSEEYLALKYRHREPDGRVYRLDNMTSPNPRPNMMYEWEGHASPPNGWRYSLDTMTKLHEEGRIWYPDAKSKRPQLKRYLAEMSGTLMGNVWTDIDPINSQAAERLGYPTQKPLALLERIVYASSNPGDVVLDPFCGCGTTIAAAQKLDRQWIGIDITSLAIALIRNRMQSMYPGLSVKTVGDPKDLDSARHLAAEDRYQFQWWALSLIPARPLGGETGSKVGKKGSDKGIDGVVNFVDDHTGYPKRVLVQVKSGNVKSGDVRDLRGTVERENAAIGVFVTLEEPTKDMRQEAVSAGFYSSPTWNKTYPKIQLLTVAELLRGSGVLMPPAHGTFKQAPVVKHVVANQAMDFGEQ